jgi:hypothetical protein
VVADAVDLEAEPVHRLDGVFLMEECRDQGAAASQVAGRHDDVVGIQALQMLDVTGEVVDAAGGNLRGLRVCAEIAGGFEVSVEVVERDDLEVELFSVSGGRRSERNKSQGHPSETRPSEVQGGRPDCPAKLHESSCSLDSTFFPGGRSRSCGDGCGDGVS